jgi:hypothetical protein
MFFLIEAIVVVVTMRSSDLHSSFADLQSGKKRRRWRSSGEHPR